MTGQRTVITPNPAYVVLLKSKKRRIRKNEEELNKWPEPTTIAVTFCADAQLAPATVVAHY
jgi:hypothetical protein